MEDDEEVEIKRVFVDFFKTLDPEDRSTIIEGALEILQEKATRQADQSASSQDQS